MLETTSAHFSKSYDLAKTMTALLAWFLPGHCFCAGVRGITWGRTALGKVRESSERSEEH